MRVASLVLVASAVAVLLQPLPGRAQDAARFYEDNCAGCHTIGGGPLAGPDLKGVTARRDRDWLIRFMLDPAAFASDPEVARMIAAADGMAMPSTDGLTRELAGAILAVIEQRSAVAQGSTPAPAERPFTAADVSRGRDLFVGSATLSASGPACIACHASGDMPEPGGGRIGPDLMHVQERLGGTRGLTAWLRATPTPMMRAVYRPAPLSEDESRALTAFLEASAAQGHSQPLRLASFVLVGIGGAAAVLAVVGVVGARRFRAVRRPLVESVRGDARVMTRHAPGTGGAAPRRTQSIAPSDVGGPR